MTDFEECLLVPYGAATAGPERLLVLAPHPDDEVLGCGGLALLTLRAGGTVCPVILTDGGAGNFSAFESAAAYVAIRRKESTRAAEILGTSPPEFLDFADRSLPARQADLLERLREVARRFAPTIVCAPSPAEVHPDHRAAARAAFDLLGEFPVELYFYEVSAPLAPNLLFRIDDVLPTKEAAIAAFASQNRERPFAELLLGLNRYRSMTLPPPARFAEGFFRVTPSDAAAGWEAICRQVGPERPDPRR